MATQPVQSAFGTDPESTAANEKWKQAYDQLIQSLDARQEKPFFNPTYLAAAQGFLTPSKTGSFFESLGTVAGNVAKAQEAEQNRALETAKARLDLAGMGVQQANQRAAMQMYQDGAAPAPAPASAPSAGAMEPSPSDFTLKSMGIDEAGVQLFPPQPLIPEKQFVASELLKGGNVPEAKIKYQEYLRKDIDTTQNGLVIQRSTGRAFEMPDPTPANVPFLSLQGEPFPTTKFFARKLDALTQANDNEGRIALENKIRGIGQRPPAPTGQPPLQVTPMPAATGIVNAPKVATITTPRPVETVPEAPPPPQMVGMRTPSQLAREKAEDEQRRAIAQAIAIEEGKAKVAAGAGAEAKLQETIGSKRGDLAVAEEAKILTNANSAGRMFVAADTVINAVKRSPNYFGIFNKPGVLNAIGATFAELAKPNSTVTIVDVGARVAQLMPGTTPENLLDREKAGSALAEIELTYTQNFMEKQGQVTEGERKIVRAIPGGMSSSPKFLEIKSKLIKERAQYDMDVSLAYNEYMRSNPRGNALDFQRNSGIYKEIYQKFQNNLADLGKTIPAVPSKERPRQDSAGSATTSSAGSYAADLLKRRMQQ
jgi:hypothetical protein